MVKSLLKPAPLTLAILLLLAVPAVVLQQPGNRLAQVLGAVVVLFCSGLLAFSVHELGHVVKRPAEWIPVRRADLWAAGSFPRGGATPGKVE